jgi:hypothetical protein
MTDSPSQGTEGHHDAAAQPHIEQEGRSPRPRPVAAEISTERQPLGRPGKPLNRSSSGCSARPVSLSRLRLPKSHPRWSSRLPGVRLSSLAAIAAG